MKTPFIVGGSNLAKLKRGAPLHVETVGRNGFSTNDAVFEELTFRGEEVTGVVVRIGKRKKELPSRKIKRLSLLPASLAHSELEKDRLLKSLAEELGRS